MVEMSVAVSQVRGVGEEFGSAVSMSVDRTHEERRARGSRRERRWLLS
jgi:hypothetical protein